MTNYIGTEYGVKRFMIKNNIRDLEIIIKGNDNVNYYLRKLENEESKLQLLDIIEGKTSMNLEDTINAIAFDISWGSTPLEDRFDCRDLEFTLDIINKVKENLNPVDLVKSCKHLNLDYKQAINELMNEEIYEEM